MTNKKILIATGGTGGHIFPAYSLSNYFKKKGYLVNLTSDKRGLKYLSNLKNLDIINISSFPLNKKNIFKTFFSLLMILFSTSKSLFFLISNRPLLVFGMGGYSSFPICIAAYILRIKLVIYENNLVIGKTNKYLLPFAKKILVAFKDLEGIPKKYKKKVFEVGNVIRDEIIYSNNQLDELNNSQSLNILVLGGSQAAKIFGEVLPPVFEKIQKTGASIKIFQQCHKTQNKQLIDFYEKIKIDSEIFNFTENIKEYYNKANLVITRSGASVLGEIINAKIPFISIPLPTSADNHQYKNAKFYSKRGYGYFIEEKNIKNQLFELLNSIIKDKYLLEKFLSNQSQYSDKDVFKNINKITEEILNEKN